MPGASAAYNRFGLCSTTYSTSYGSSTIGYNRTPTRRSSATNSNLAQSPSTAIQRTRSRPLPSGPGPLDLSGKKLPNYNVSSTASNVYSSSRVLPLRAEHQSFGSIRNTSTPPSNLSSNRNHFTGNGDILGISRPRSSSRSRRSPSLNDIANLSITEPSNTRPTYRSKYESKYDSSTTKRNNSSFGRDHREPSTSSTTTSNNRNTSSSRNNGYRDDEIFGRSSGNSLYDNERADGTSRSGYKPSVSRDQSPSGRRPAQYLDESTPPKHSSVFNGSSTMIRQYSYGGQVGLANLGNTCYMNCILQCLSHSKPLLEYMLEKRYINEINKTSSQMKGNLMAAYSSLINDLWSERGGDVKADSLKKQMGSYQPRFRGLHQHDCQEFLRYLLEGLHEDVNKVKQKPPHQDIDDAKLERKTDAEKAREHWMAYLKRDNSHIVDIFVGQLKSELRFSQCDHRSVTFDPFWDLSLSIPKGSGRVTLEECIHLFMKPEELKAGETPMCAKCKEKRSCLKSFSIQKFPRILVLHLKRFGPENFSRKISKHVVFPLKGLDLAQFGDNEGRVLYDLYGVANHLGVSGAGHYVAYVKHASSGQWYHFNDSRVSSVRSDSVLDSEAYVLFYERTTNI